MQCLTCCVRSASLSQSYTAVAGGAGRQHSGRQAPDVETQPSQQQDSGGGGAAQEVARLTAQAAPSPSAQPPDSDASPADDAIEWEDVAPAAVPAAIAPSLRASEPVLDGEDASVRASKASEQDRSQPAQPSEKGM